MAQDLGSVFIELKDRSVDALHRVELPIQENHFAVL